MAGAERQDGSSNKPPKRGSGPTKSSTTVQVIRETDLMRAGSDAILLELTVDFLRLRTRASFGINDAVKVRLQNNVQRCDKEVRGRVRKFESDDAGATISVDLFTRLTPLEVSMLKMGITATDAQPRWL